MSWPPRDETLRALNEIDAYYRDALGRPAETTLCVDREGIAVWCADQYTKRRVAGESHDQAMSHVLADIARVAGIAPEAPTVAVQGRLRIEGQGYRDDAGSILPVLAHAGDLLSRWWHGHRAEVEAILDTIQQAGYGGCRVWSFLTGAYWAGREVNPDGVALSSFLDACRARDLKVLLSQGDLFQRQVSTSTREQLRATILGVLDAGYRDVFAGIDGANEAVNNGGATPEQLANWLTPILHRTPDLICSLTSPLEGRNAEEDAAIRAAFCIPPATIYDHHTVGDSPIACVRRHWNQGYEGNPTWLGVASEPRGPGSRVSVLRVEDPDILCLMALAAVMAGQMYVYFCGPGVISDEGERFEDMPAFWDVAPLVASLPRDLHAWPTRCHGGSRWAGTRVFAVPGGTEARADQVIADDGRFCALLYQEGWQDCYQDRAARIDRVQMFGAAGQLVMGHVV